VQTNLSIALRRTLGWLMIGGLLLAAANAVRAAGTGLSAEQKISQLRIVKPQPASGLPGNNPGLHLPHPCLASEEVNGRLSKRDRFGNAECNSQDTRRGKGTNE